MQASTVTAKAQACLTPFEQLRMARSIIRAEGKVVLSLAGQLDEGFCAAVDQLHACNGCVIVCGIGKAGLIGQKITATLASTGTRSHFLHPSEAMHGDLGRIHPDDVVLMLSHSGETEEVVRLLPSLRDLGVSVIAITGKPESTLAKHASVTLSLGSFPEADPLGLAPSSSSTAMLAMGDAVALVASRMRGTSPDDFARSHPGGSLGRKLAKVEDVMQSIDRCRIASETLTVREALIAVSRPGRRNGAIMITGDQDRLTGIFTDSDLARLFECRADDQLDHSIRDVMTRHPTSLTLGSTFQEAIDILISRRISELPIVDERGCPAGLIDITDVVGLLPGEENGDRVADGVATEESPSQETPENDSIGGRRILPFSSST